MLFLVSKSSPHPVIHLLNCLCRKRFLKRTTNILFVYIAVVYLRFSVWKMGSTLRPDHRLTLDFLPSSLGHQSLGWFKVILRLFRPSPPASTYFGPIDTQAPRSAVPLLIFKSFSRLPWWNLARLITLQSHMLQISYYLTKYALVSPHRYTRWVSRKQIPPLSHFREFALDLCRMSGQSNWTTSACKFAYT